MIQTKPSELQTGGRRSRKRRRNGQTMVEFIFIMPVLFALIFIQLDIAFAVYAQATLLQAVRQGIRFGVTNNLNATACPGASGMEACVKQKVVWAANGLLSGAYGNDVAKVTVKCYAYNPALPGLQEPSSSWTNVPYNAGSNVMVVSVNSYRLPLLLPVIFLGPTGSVDKTPMTFSVAAADRIEPIVTSNLPAW
jgi:Flp pilus assembly protein TadG